MIKFVVFCRRGHIVTLSPERELHQLPPSECWCGEAQLKGLVDWLIEDTLVPYEPIGEGDRRLMVKGTSFTVSVPVFDVSRLFHAQEEQY